MRRSCRAGSRRRSRRTSSTAPSRARAPKARSENHDPTDHEASVLLAGTHLAEVIPLAARPLALDQVAEAPPSTRGREQSRGGRRARGFGRAAALGCFSSHSWCDRLEPLGPLDEPEQRVLSAVDDWIAVGEQEAVEVEVGRSFRKPGLRRVRPSRRSSSGTSGSEVQLCQPSSSQSKIAQTRWSSRLIRRLDHLTAAPYSHSEHCLTIGDESHGGERTSLQSCCS